MIVITLSSRPGTQDCSGNVIVEHDLSAGERSLRIGMNARFVAPLEMTVN